MQFLEFIKSIPAAIKPFFIGFIIAYILSLPCNKFQNLFGKKLSKKKANILACICTEIVFIGIIAAFSSFIIPKCVESISKIIEQYPKYIESLQRNYQVLIENNEFIKKSALSRLNISNEINKYTINTITGESEGFINGIYERLSIVGTAVYNILVGFIASLFIIYNRDAASKNFYEMVKVIFKRRGEFITFFIKEVNSVFRQFIIGKGLDSLIVGICIFLIFLIFKIPFALVLAVFICITNMIPIIGPIVGAIPGAILLFAEYPDKVVPFLIIVLVIQQIDGYFLGPKCIGGIVHLNTFWVLFSVMFFGKVFGIAGAFLGVPTFAVIYDVIQKRIVVKNQNPTIMDILLDEEEEKNKQKKERKLFKLW